MRTATAIIAPPLTLHSPSTVAGTGQIPLPFPGLSPVLPAPIERGDARVISERSARFMQALVEVLSGVRPVRQMATWMAPDVYSHVVSRLNVHSAIPPNKRATRKPRIVSVHVSMVNDHAAEIAGRMSYQGRSRAIAARLELQTTHRGTKIWRCTALAWA